MDPDKDFLCIKNRHFLLFETSEKEVKAPGEDLHIALQSWIFAFFLPLGGHGSGFRNFTASGSKIPTQHLCPNCWSGLWFRSELCNPEAILVLLTNDLVAIDCRSTGLPSYENPYAMDFQVQYIYITVQISHQSVPQSAQQPVFIRGSVCRWSRIYGSYKQGGISWNRFKLSSVKILFFSNQKVNSVDFRAAFLQIISTKNAEKNIRSC